MFVNRDFPRETTSFPSSSSRPKHGISVMIALIFVALVVGGALFLSKTRSLKGPEEVVAGSTTESISTEVEDIDSDGDGLSDSDENYYGTNINLADSDNDGYGDLQEINSGFNPLGAGKLTTPKRVEEKKVEKLKPAPVVSKLSAKNFSSNPLSYLSDKVKSYLNIGSLLILFVRFIFFIFIIFIFANILKFVLNKFFKIDADFEKALTIATLQTLSHTFIDYAAGIILFFAGSPLLSLPLSLLSIVLSFFVYNYILKSFLKTSTAQNVGIIILTGLVMFLVSFMITIIMGIVLMPIMIFVTSVFHV